MRVAIVVLLLASAGALAQEVKREVIYGAEMMTRTEREQYRQSLERAKSEEEATKVRTRHREQIQKRARARGETLTESGLLEKPKEKDAK